LEKSSRNSGMVFIPMSDKRTFSPTQLRAYDHCPQEHHYSYTEKIQRSIATTFRTFDFGNYAHELMHVYYQTLKLGGHKPGSEFLVKMMESRVKNDLLQANFNNIELVSLVWPRLLTYFTYQSPQIDKNIEILGVEKEFKTPVTTPNGHEVLLHGWMDLIYRDSAGRIRIRDHKTGQNVKTHTTNSVMLDDQLGFYGAANAIHDVEISFINSYLHKGKNQPPINTLFGFHRYQHSSVGLSVIESNILEKIDKILDTKPHKNYSPLCPSCQFFELCHAETRGLDVQRIKTLHYRTKVDNARSSVKLNSPASKASEHTNDNEKFTISFTDV
jgi:hypothetical protein